jgi:hypothetical protein
MNMALPYRLALLAFCMAAFAAIPCGFSATGSPPPVVGNHSDRISAALAWLEEDTALAEASGMPDLAAARRADLAAMNSSPPAETPAAALDDLLPPITHADGNPVMKEFFKGLDARVLKPDKRFVKGPEGGKARTEEGWAFCVRADELLQLAQAFCQPQSPLAGDPALVAPILRRLAFFAEYMAAGGPVLGDFGPCGTDRCSRRFRFRPTSFPSASCDR